MKWKTKLKFSSLDPSEYNVFVTEDWEMGAKRTFSGDQVPDKFFLRPPAKAFKRVDRLKGKDNFSLSR
jgi:hypothetical protein